MTYSDAATSFVDEMYESMWRRARLLAAIPSDELKGNTVVVVATVEEANG